MVHEVDDGCSADGALSHEVLVHINPDVAAARASAVQAPEVPEGYLLVVLHNGSKPLFFSIEYNHFKHFNFDGLGFIKVLFTVEPPVFQFSQLRRESGHPDPVEVDEVSSAILLVSRIYLITARESLVLN